MHLWNDGLVSFPDLKIKFIFPKMHQSCYGKTSGKKNHAIEERPPRYRTILTRQKVSEIYAENVRLGMSYEFERT